MPQDDPGNPGPRVILIFDGVCALCSRTVRLVTRHERTPGTVWFAPMQSEAGRELLRQHGFDPNALSSVVLIEDGTAHIRSDAVLRLAGYLRAPWWWARVLRVVPRPLLDAGYRLLAKHRYRIFGRVEYCETAGSISERTLETRRG